VTESRRREGHRTGAQDTVTGEDRVLDVTVFRGHRAHSEHDLVMGQVDLEENGYVRTGLGSFTNVDGLFARRRQDHVYRQAVTSAGSGCIAAIDAERCSKHKSLTHHTDKVSPGARRRTFGGSYERADHDPDRRNV